MKNGNKYTQEQKLFLLSLARETLEHFFATGQVRDYASMVHSGEMSIDRALLEKRGTFVTLTSGRELRGCIGHIEPVQEIYLDVVENVLSATLDDHRFDPVEEDELSRIKIEISILSEPKELSYSSSEDLLRKLRPEIDGVVIERGKYGATYLPQVWEDLPDKEKFLSSLCEKAGLGVEEWKKGELKVFTYQAEVFSA